MTRIPKYRFRSAVNISVVYETSLSAAQCRDVLEGDVPKWDPHGQGLKWRDVHMDIVETWFKEQCENALAESLRRELPEEVELPNYVGMELKETDVSTDLLVRFVDPNPMKL